MEEPYPPPPLTNPTQMLGWPYKPPICDMTQLTKEHLDKALDKHFKKVDHRKEGFDTIQQQLDVRHDVNQLKLKVARISQAIGLSK